MIFSSAFLNTFVAPYFADFTAIEAPDMSAHNSQQAFWVSNYILNSAFSARLVEPKRQLAMAFLRRAEMAFVEYEAGRAAARAVVSHEPNRVSRYFEALHHFEVCVSVTYQAELLVAKLVEVPSIFKKGDGSPLQRLNELYQYVKHSDERIEVGQFPSEGTTPIWLTNDGIECAKCKLTFKEMAERLGDIAIDATNISDPDRMRREKASPFHTSNISEPHT